MMLPGVPAASVLNQKWRAPGVVVVGRLTQEREPQYVAVEGGGAFEIGADHRRMMDPGDAHAALL